jgi:phage tail-like protein
MSTRSWSESRYVREREPDLEASREAPAVASRRRYLRAGLPAIYQEGRGSAFALGFVEALETLLDPIVALLDALPAHFSVDLAPQDVLELMTAWLGIGLDEADTDEQRREVARNAARICRLRGTKEGLELALRLEFRDVTFRVEDCGGVAWGDDGRASLERPDPGFVVCCEAAVSDERLLEIATLIEYCRPVNTTYQLKTTPAAAVQREGA